MVITYDIHKKRQRQVGLCFFLSFSFTFNNEYILVDSCFVIFLLFFLVFSFLFSYIMFCMTPEYLQDTHKEVYTTFFQRFDIVVSGSHALRWWHAVGRGDAHMSIKQKVPNRMYCGISPREWSDIIFEDIVYYNQAKDEYISVSATQLLWKKRVEMLLDELRNMLSIEYRYTDGFVCSVLSEYPRWFGFGFFGVVVSTILAWVEVLTENLSAHHLEQYDYFLQSDKYTSLCERIYEVNNACTSSTSGCIQHVSFGSRESLYIMMYVWDEDKSKPRFWKYMETRFLHTLDTLVGRDVSIDSMSVDFWLISFGVWYDSSHVKRNFQEFKDTYEHACDFLHTLSKQNKSTLFDTIQASSNIEYMSLFLYTNILKYFVALCKYASDTMHVNSLIQAITDCGLYNILIERDKENLLALYYRFDQLKQFTYEKIGLVPVSSSRSGGTFLFVCRASESRSTIDKLTAKMHEEWYKELTLSYASWRDGWSSTWLLIDQHISKNMYSSFIRPWSVLFVWWNGNTYVDVHEDILQQQQKGIILDRIYNKVYIDGKKLTHKDMCSQSWTVEIVTRLMRNEWQYVDNGDLPMSSYSKNKNEMLWKIVLPFKQLVQIYCNTDLQLICSGSIHDFQMRIHMWEVDCIHIIDRLR